MAESIAYALVTYAGASTAAATAWSYVIVVAATVAYGGYQQRKAKARARDAANANAKDREVMIRSAIAPRRYIYGRDRVSGPIAYMQSTGDKQQYLHLVLPLAAHECDAIEEVYFNEVPLGPLDGDGFVTSGDFVSPDTTEYGTHQGTTNGSGEITLPRSALTIEAAYQEVGIGANASQTHYPDRTHTSGTALVGNLPADTAVTITYTYTLAGASKVRIKKHLGGTGQTADAALIAESGGLWTSDHIGAGICYLYVRLEYDQDIFGSIGVPNISAVVRGKKVYDPRTTTTAWSNNAALCTADFLRSDEGMRATSTQVPDAEVITAANVCDEAVDLYEGGTVAVTNGSAAVVGTGTTWTTHAAQGLTFLGPDAAEYTILSIEDDTHLTLASTYAGSTASGQAYVLQQLRYTCDTSFTAERSPRDVLAELATCMAGRCVWTQGRWLVRAGAHRTPTLTITADMLAGTTSVAPKASRSDLFNAIRATYRDVNSYAELQAPLVLNAGYETEDGGVRIPRQIDIPTLADTFRAQRLAKIELERARQALSVRISTNLRAYDLAPTDTVMLTLSLYGWTSKVFEVLERTMTREGLLQYTLRETAAGVWDWNFGEATIGDLAPDTDLPSPFEPPAALQNLTVTQESLLLSDGTVILQALLEWDASTDAFVLGGGRIEVQWSRAEPISIIGGSESGDATSTVLSPLIAGLAYIARVRQVNASGREGPWAYVNFIAEADDNPPEDVTNLDWEIKPGLVRITCDPCIAADYAATELRYLNTVPDYDSGDWAAATFLVKGATNEYHHPRPPNGTYYVLAKHLDTSGNYSTGTSYITVVVDDSIDSGGAGTLRLSASSFPFFSFADGTTHTAQAPGNVTLTFTATLYGLVGTATFTAEAFNSSNVSLGTFTLGGTGNARTMTAAQFVSLGTSGSVRTVVVTAALGSAADSLTVYRQDSTTTAPRIFLDNPVAQVPTDEAGEYGDFSGAATGVLVYAGLSDVTSTYTFAITPDSGVTATINGGAGPVSGTGSVAVAVSASTIDDAAVLITTSGPGVLAATFRVTKQKASGAGYTAFFTPDEIRLPVNANGTVASYANAESVFTIQLGALDDTAQWALAKEDQNVSSTLTGSTVTITDFHDLGETGSSTSASMTLPSGWDRPQSLVWAGDAWITLGYHASTGFTKLLRSTDFVSWNEVTTPAGQWQFGAYGGGRVILPKWDAVTSDYIDSTDGGATWSTVKSLGASAQWSCITYGSGLWLVGALGTTSGRQSSDGTTWSLVTFPAVPYELYHVPGLGWFLKDGSDAWRFSTSGTGSWSSTISALTGVSHIRGVAGRAVGFTSGTSAVYSENGTTWTTVTLPQSYSVEYTQIVRGVLYLAGTDGKLQYTTDGKTWVYAGGSVGTTVSYLGMRALGADLDTDSLHSINTTGSYLHNTTPLLATSADTGFVTITATKPNAADIVRSLPVRKGTAAADVYTSQATPASVLLPSTSDGVVTSYTAGVVVAQINRNGVDDTANWTISWTTTNLTPASGTGATVTLTAMTDGILSGAIYFTAAKAGQPLITGTVGVFKSYGVESSGPRIGAAFNAITASATWIGLKFVGDGRFQIKVGSGGSYVDAGQWAGAVRSSNASAYWIRVESSGHSLNSGTTGTWLAMTSDREYTLSDATSGIHRTDLQVLIGTNSSGANAVLASGALQLVVP